MVYLGVFPLFFAMAGLATFTQLILVYIVLLMAGNAILRQFLLIQVTHMAGNAFNLFVLVLQCIFRVTSMVETDHLPVFFGVAGLALRTETVLMFVILLVATNTGCGNFCCWCFQFRLVTGIALGCDVFA